MKNKTKAKKKPIKEDVDDVVGETNEILTTPRGIVSFRRMYLMVKFENRDNTINELQELKSFGQMTLQECFEVSKLKLISKQVEGTISKKELIKLNESLKTGLTKRDCLRILDGRSYFSDIKEDEEEIKEDKPVRKGSSLTQRCVDDKENSDNFRDFKDANGPRRKELIDKLNSGEITSKEYKTLSKLNIRAFNSHMKSIDSGVELVNEVNAKYNTPMGKIKMGLFDGVFQLTKAFITLDIINTVWNLRKKINSK